ncbi:MAG TPA: hypothetical protein DHV62_07760 [Elusimicrobia bacterium]|nr:hypothetical protein [Elusimicrobiota bacterium]
MPEQIDKTLDNADGNQDSQELDANGNPIVKAEPPATDWENEANPYRKRYSDSQSQIQPLVRTLQQFAEYDHATKAWKPKTQAPVTTVQNEDFERMLDGYDPDFKKALVGYTQKQIKDAIAEYRKESVFMTEYNSSITAARNKAIEEFGSEFDFAKGGKFNPDSPLYKLANEILYQKYAQFNPDGTFHSYTSPDAEYMATVEAYAIISKRSKQQPPQNTGKLNAIQGKGTKAAGVKRQLTFEEYSKLTDEQKDAYDLQQAG